MFTSRKKFEKLYGIEEQRRRLNYENIMKDRQAGGEFLPNQSSDTTELFHIGGDNNDEDGIFITSI